MGTEKRERQKANRQARLEQERKLEQRANLRQRVITFGIIGVLLFGALFLYSVASGDDSDDTATAGNELDPEISTTTTEEATATSAGADVAPVGECPAEDGSSPRYTQFAEPPPMCIDETATYLADVSTDKGSFTIELDASRAPLTVNNFVVLARYHFYDGVAFHRIIPDFVVQGGDAVGDPPGTGNPGYSFPDELPEEGDYEIGSVAMANSGPDTNGSQFFVVTGENGVALPPQYSLFGTVTDGLGVVRAIESTGSSSGEPTEPTVIESVTITEKEASTG